MFPSDAQYHTETQCDASSALIPTLQKELYINLTLLSADLPLIGLSIST
jgi:hypothetical protein